MKPTYRQRVAAAAIVGTPADVGAGELAILAEEFVTLVHRFASARPSVLAGAIAVADADAAAVLEQLEDSAVDAMVAAAER